MPKTAAQRANEPTQCPYCGQALIDKKALIHLHKSQRELDRGERERLQVARRELEGRFRQKRLALEQNLERRKRSLRTQLLKELKPEIAAQVRRSERSRIEKERQRDEAEVARRERSLQQKVRRLERLLENQKEENERLQRATERLTPAERGEFAEEHIKDVLRQNFPEDRISKTTRGKAGSDIFQEVRVNDTAVGLILYECKDTTRWLNSYVSQCREQGKRHGTKYLVVVSRAFPRSEKNLFVRNGVIVVDPSCLLQLAYVMRRLVLEVANADLSAGDQQRSIEELFQYVRSDEFRESLQTLIQRAQEMRGLLQKEQLAHQKTWTRREHAYAAITEVSVRVETQIREIVQKRTTNGRIAKLSVGEARRRHSA